MTKSQLVKFSGWAFILGGFGFATILTGSDPIAFTGSVISSILLAVGMLGVRARYAERAGGFGRNILRIGAIATVFPYVGLVTLTVVPNAVQLVNQGLWILMFGGPAVALLGLALFGLVALRSRPMPRMNWLPILAGIWYPVFYFFLAGYLFTHSGVYPGQYQIAFNIVHLIQFLALCVLGVVLVSDASEQMATA